MPLVQVHGVDDVRIDEVPCPHAGPRDVLLRVVSCGICGSDLGYISQGGLTPPGVPMPLGHELSGTVEALGSEVTGLQLGQRVTVNPMAGDLSIGNGGPEGGFAPLLLVRDVAGHPDAVMPLPDTLDFDEGALIEPLSVAQHGINRAAVSAGEPVVVLGAGPIGLCAVAALRYRGVDNIVVADQSPRRLQIARSLGASTLCNVTDQDLEACLRGAHGESQLMGMPMPATAVYIEATGVGAVLEQAIAMAGPQARIAVLGVHKAPIELDPLVLLFKELQLVGSMAYPEEFPQVIAMLASGDIDLGPLVTHHFPLEHFMDALATARDPQRAAKVMIRVDGAGS
jgi:threonine dehydrogenase-like Zn-dependent dehydrogenase